MEPGIERKAKHGLPAMLLTIICCVLFVGAMPNFTVGVWQNVEPAAFHNPSNMQTVAVAVDPRDGSVLASASNKTNGGSGCTGIYKSTDCGSTWKLWSTGTNSSHLLTSQMWAMLIDPTHPDNVYVCNGYGDWPNAFESTDGGVNWAILQTDPAHATIGNFVQAIAFEHGNPQHIAVTFHENGNPPFNSNVMSQSTNGGATWADFNGPPVGGWREGSTLTVLGPTSYFYGCDIGGWYTSDGGQSWTKVIQDGIMGRYAGSTEITPNGSTIYIGGLYNGVYVSHATAGSPLGSSWTLMSGTPTQFTNIIDDGVYMYAATINGPPFYKASLSAPTTWTHMNSPGVTCGSNEMAYDAINHIIYSGNFQNGLLAMKTSDVTQIATRSKTTATSALEMHRVGSELLVSAPTEVAWQISLYALNGACCAEFTGKGPASLSLARNFAGVNSIVAKMTSTKGNKTGHFLATSGKQ